jgi:hypothetical protein
MRYYAVHSIVRFAATLCVLSLAARAEAVTQILNREVEMNDGGNTGIINRPFFTAGGPDGYVGTATLGGTDTMSTVTNPNVGVGGNSTNLSTGNNIPLGVGVNFGISFTVETSDSNHFLSDNGNTGLGINSGGSDTNTNELSAGEQLFFSNIQLTNVSIYDPLGLLQPGATVGNPQWKALRSSTFAAPSDFASTSSDAGVTTDVKMFDDVTNIIGNNYSDGTFGPLPSVYVTTTGGNWPLKGIRFEVPITFEVATTAPATRRTFQFSDPSASYDNFLTHQLTASDTTISIAAIGDAGAVLDTNNLGVGVNSNEDDFTLGLPTSNANQRFIDGSLTTPEAIQFSFDQDVSFESLTLGNFDLDGSEGVVLKYISGTNPFTGLTGYSGDYTLGADSLTFSTAGGGQTPYAITYGMNGQDEIMIAAGTVLSLTSNPAAGNGFILDMITVNVATLPGDHNKDGTVDAADYVVWRKTNIGGDQGYLDWRAHFGDSNLGSGAVGGSSLGAVPEPASFLLALVGLLIVGGSCRRPR